MTRLAICPLVLRIYPLLLALSIQHGVSTQPSVILEVLPSDVGDVTCTGNLQCESSNFFCMPGDLHTADHPVLVPKNISSRTVKKCNKAGCGLCMQVVMDVVVAFLSADARELGSGGCDYEEQGYYYYDEEEEDTTTVNLDLTPTNGSYLCADVYISLAHHSLSCNRVKVSLPQNMVPQRTDTSCVKVGSLVYNCIDGIAGSYLTPSVFTNPRYFEIVTLKHDFPQCEEMDPEANVPECEAPSMVLDIFTDNVSISLTNETLDKNVTLFRYWNSKSNGHQASVPLRGTQRYSFPNSDIVPCLCFHLYYDEPFNARRHTQCPFLTYPEEITLNKSRLVWEFNGNNLLYNLSAPCDMMAEVALCWKSSDLSVCREFPDSRKQITSQTKLQNTLKLEQLHPSVCLQVWVKGEILHTNCSLVKGTHRMSHEEAIVLVSQSDSKIVSICQIKDEDCDILYNDTHQVRADAVFMEKMIVQDVLAHRCMKIWISDNGQHVSVCSLDIYVRSKWNWSRILSLLAIACVVLIVLLNNKLLKKWIKSMNEDKDLGDIFRDRRLLILYSPDSPEYEHLVRIFASSLKELRLDVVLDQWHSVEISQINPLPWYHRQKSLISENKGLILLLFSEGARDKYVAWKEQKLGGLTDYSFGAVLSCVHSDFEDRTAKGLYAIGFFNFYSQNVVPKLFSSVPAYNLPSQLPKLLREIAGDCAKKFSRNQVGRLVAVISDKLRPPMKACQDSMFNKTAFSQSSSSTSASTISDGSVAVELQPLM